jgi:hypothetical protein
MAEDNPQAIKVKVPGAPNAQNVERAIQEKLKADDTDLFHNTDTVIFVCKKEGN